MKMFLVFLVVSTSAFCRICVGSDVTESKEVFLNTTSRGWTGWKKSVLDRKATSQIAAVYSHGVTSDIFYRSESFSLIHAKLHSDGTLSNIRDRGGVLVSGPSAVALPPGGYAVVVADAVHDVHLGTLSPAGTWTWRHLTGRTISTPAIAATGGDNLEVFRRGPDNVLYWLSIHGGVIGSWKSMGVYTTASPTVFSSSTGTFDVVIRDYKNSLLHKRFSTSGQLGADDLCSQGWTSIPSSGLIITSPKMIKTRDHPLLLYAIRGGVWPLQRYHFSGSSWNYLNHGGSRAFESTPALVDTPTRFQVVDIFGSELHLNEYVY